VHEINKAQFGHNEGNVIDKNEWSGNKIFNFDAKNILY